MASDLKTAQPEAPAEPSPSLIEAVDTLLEQTLCGCPRAMRFDRGEHLSGCHLFDLNLARFATPAPAARQPAGYALVPLKMNAEMNRVTAEEGWQWADLLAAAEAVTEEQYAEASGPAQQPAELTHTQLHDIIGEHLTSAYCCTRVWDAWNVGTMSRDDFTPLADTDFQNELADAIIKAQGGSQ